MPSWICAATLALMEGDIPSSLATTPTNIERPATPGSSPAASAPRGQALDFEVPSWRTWVWMSCGGWAVQGPTTRATRRSRARAGKHPARRGRQLCHPGRRRDLHRRHGPARNEYLFQQLAQANIETLKQYKFKVILTQCPHCYNTLLNEYPQFGGNFQVMHHTQYIEALLAEQNIRVQPDHDRGQQITFHDPCYLGRYNDEYEAPRALATASGMQLVEMARTRDQAMCCGGGGARVWLEEEGDIRVNRNRLAHIQATGASQAAAACPFCLIMLEDARGALDAENLVIRDVAEIVADALVEPAQKQLQD